MLYSQGRKEGNRPHRSDRSGSKQKEGQGGLLWQGEKSLVEELEKIIIESDQEIKRLNKTITKLKQKENNRTLFYEYKLAELEQKNEEYRTALELREGQRSRWECQEGQDMRKSQKSTKIGRTRQQSFWRHPSRENNQNVNTLNAYIQPCSHPHCCEIVQEVKKQSEAIATRLEQLIRSIKMRNFEEFSDEDVQQWSRQLMAERTKWKGDQGKTSLFLLKKVQNNIEQLQTAFDRDQGRQLSEPLALALKSLKVKQANLMKIPFLEKMEVEERREQYQKIVQECRLVQEGLAGMLVRQ